MTFTSYVWTYEKGTENILNFEAHSRGARCAVPPLGPHPRLVYVRFRYSSQGEFNSPFDARILVSTGGLVDSGSSTMTGVVRVVTEEAFAQCTTDLESHPNFTRVPFWGRSAWTFRITHPVHSTPSRFYGIFVSWGDPCLARESYIEPRGLKS